MARLKPIHPRTPQHVMPFVPGLKVSHPGALLFVSGATANPLYHAHPHDPSELTPPDDISEQTRRVMENLKLVLDAAGARFQDVVKITKFLTRTEEQDAVRA